MEINYDISSTEHENASFLDRENDIRLHTEHSKAWVLSRGQLEVYLLIFIKPFPLVDTDVHE